MEAYPLQRDVECILRTFLVARISFWDKGNQHETQS